jgi:hypothetical protein
MALQPKLEATASPGSIQPLARGNVLWRAVYGGVVYLPHYGLSSLALHHLGELCQWGNSFFWMEAAPGLIGTAGALELCRRALPRGWRNSTRTKQPQKKNQEIILNGMAYDRVALVCNILVLGGIRSGKTSGTLDWATDQLLKVFNDRDDELGDFSSM